MSELLLIKMTKELIESGEKRLDEQMNEFYKRIDEQMNEFDKRIDGQMNEFDKRISSAVNSLPGTLTAIRKQSEEGTKVVIEQQADVFAETIRDEVSIEVGAIRKQVGEFSQSITETYKTRTREIKDSLDATDTELGNTAKQLQNLMKQFDSFGRRVDKSLEKVTFKIEDVEKRTRQSDIQIASQSTALKNLNKAVDEVADSVTQDDMTVGLDTIEESLQPGMTFGGEWQNNTKYQTATVVKYLATLWISSAPSTGVAPNALNQEIWSQFQTGGAGGGFSTLAKERATGGGGGGGLPNGGLTGQLLRKNSAASQDASWSDLIDAGGF